MVVTVLSESESERYLTRCVVHELYQFNVLIMKFTLPSLLLAIAAVFVPAACIGIPSVEKRVSCAEAARFGILEIVPSTVAPGDVRRSPMCLVLNHSSLIIH